MGFEQSFEESQKAEVRRENTHGRGMGDECFGLEVPKWTVVELRKIHENETVIIKRYCQSAHMFSVQSNQPFLPSRSLYSTVNSPIEEYLPLPVSSI